MTTPLPKRKKLPHHVPHWVENWSNYFITINLREREKNILCQDGRAKALLDSFLVYENLQKWYPHVAVIMPDHVHFIVSMNLKVGICAVIKSWKSFHAKKLNIHWQEGFFEHRLRDDNEFKEKVLYIRMNPVRKGLVDDWHEWPHFLWRRYKIVENR